MLAGGGLGGALDRLRDSAGSAGSADSADRSNSVRAADEALPALPALNAVSAGDSVCTRFAGVAAKDTNDQRYSNENREYKGE